MLSKEQWRQRWVEAENWAFFIDEHKYLGVSNHTIDCGDMRLVPLCPDVLEVQPTLITRLARWRQDNKDAYPDDPPIVDAESYLMWLEQDYYPEPRLLWLAYPAGDWHYPIGHMGFRLNRETWPTCELDGILRGEDKPEDMPDFMVRLFNHINDLIQPDVWTVYPRPENRGALRFYTRCGFAPVDKPGHMYEGQCEAWEWRRA